MGLVESGKICIIILQKNYEKNLYIFGITTSIMAGAINQTHLYFVHLVSQKNRLNSNQKVECTSKLTACFTKKLSHIAPSIKKIKNDCSHIMAK